MFRQRNPGIAYRRESLSEDVMKQRTLANWLKVLIIIVGLFGIAVYGFIIPELGKDLAVGEFESWYYPWLIFLLGTAIPCFIALVFGWFILSNIAADRSFCVENAKHLKAISVLAAVDSVYFFVGNTVYLFLSMSHPGVFILSFMLTMVGVTVSVASAAISHLVLKAAELQDQSDLTI